jgi:thiol-disulfide isomerase/thioredoxin
MQQINYFLFAILFLLAGCTEKAPLSGTLKMSPAGDWSAVIYLIQPRSLDEVATSFMGQVLDSAVVQADGRFAFRTMPDAPEPILLELAVQQKGERFFNKKNNDDPAAANYFPIVWKNGDQMEVTAAAEQFQSSFSITNPSAENAALLQLRDVRLKAFQEFLSEKNKSASHDEEAHLLEDEEAARLHFQQPIMAFAQQTDYLLPALVAIRWVSPDNDFERIPEFLVGQCEKWRGQFPDHPWVSQLCQKSIRDQLPVLIGDTLPDAALPMLAGDTVALSQLLGKRLTILDLWASWCAPCRRENRNFLVPLWDQYHEQGLQIIGYALDGGEGPWKKAIEKDGASRWSHASHLQGDDAPLMHALRIQTIPANFLLDAEGKVVAKNLHGEELVKFVEGYLGE